MNMPQAFKAIANFCDDWLAVDHEKFLDGAVHVLMYVAVGHHVHERSGRQNDGVG
jgi:hypothetical protein